MTDPATSPAPDLVRLDREGGVVTLTITNGKVNALSVEVLGELRDAVVSLGDSPPGAVVITGGPRIFAAGADISQFCKRQDPGRVEVASREVVERIGAAFLDAFNAVAALRCPTIASISGFALGGGCELAIACDLRVASSRARFGQPEILLGIIPGGGGTQRLARLVGPARAKDLVFTGRQVGAEEALRIGLVDRVVEPDELVRRTVELAESLAAGPRKAMAAAKRSIDGGLDVEMAEGLLVEQRAFVDVFSTPDAATGIGSFLEHGPGHARFG